MGSNPPDVFEYLDYRSFLQAYYDWGKANRPEFSYRRFSRDAGYRSPNMLKLVIQGQRNLTAESTRNFARAMGMAKEEREFFAQLVEFGQAKTAEEANSAWSNIASSHRFRQARRIDSHLYEYLSHWYYPAIRELAGRVDFQADPEWVSRQLTPEVTVGEAARALETLFDLGLLVDRNGSVTRGEPSLTTGHSVKWLAIGNYHREMLAQASRAIAEVKGAYRDISALTVCIDEEMIAEVKRRIRAFRAELLDLCDSCEDPKHVYQLNFQFFPLSRPEQPEETETNPSVRRIKRPGTATGLGTPGSLETPLSQDSP